MRNFRAPLNLNMCKAMTGKHLCRVSFLIKLQAGALQLYLNETPAQMLSCEFFSVSQNTYLEKIYERLFLLLFVKFHFFLCQELQGNENQRFSNYVNVNQFTTIIAKFHVMWKDVYLHEATVPVFCSAKHSSRCKMFIVFSAYFKLIWMIYA